MAAFESRDRMMRLWLLIGPSAPDLHSLRWELLRDPETRTPLAISERILFSRFMLSRDWRVVKLRPKAELKALIAVSAPSDLAAYQLAPVDQEGEVVRARAGLAGIQATVLLGATTGPLGWHMAFADTGRDRRLGGWSVHLTCLNVFAKTPSFVFLPTCSLSESAELVSKAGS